MLTLNNINIDINNERLISNLSFTLFPSACLNIYGSNGSGKSTLLKHISSLSRIEKGKISYNGIDVSEAIDEYRWLVSFLGHANSLSNELSVNENIRFWAGINNREETTDAALSCLNLLEYSNKKIANLSAGLKRKVALTKLLVSNSSIWFLDEPFANLDKESRKSFCDVIQTRCSSGAIVIITSHDPLTDFPMMHLNLQDFQNE